MLIAGGAVWTAASIIGGSDGSARFYVSELLWVAAQTALLAGTVALWRLRPHGARRAGTAGFVTTTAGRAIFVIAELLALAQGAVQDDLLPIAALMTAAGMIIAGVAIAREGLWAGWTRFAPFAIGLYPVVAMFPFAASADGPPTPSLAGWGLLAIALGAATRCNEAISPAPPIPGARRDRPIEQTR